MGEEPIFGENLEKYHIIFAEQLHRSSSTGLLTPSLQPNFIELGPGGSARRYLRKRYLAYCR
jgi:hypothetical protein